MSKIPVTVITGFLGAGKTTLIRHLLGHAKGKRIALVINEFGDLGVDKEVLAACGEETCREEDMIELSNGCICCTVADDFIPTMETLLGRAERPDHIIIETIGPRPAAAADPRLQLARDQDAGDDRRRGHSRGRGGAQRGPLCRRRAGSGAAARGGPDARSRDPARRAVQGSAGRRRSPRGQQDRPRRARLHSTTSRPGCAPKCGRAPASIRARNGHVDIAALLGLGLASEDHLEGRDSAHELEHGGEGHEHDDFDSFSIRLPDGAGTRRAARPYRARRSARTTCCGSRALPRCPARTPASPSRRWGPRVNAWFDRPWKPGEARETALVVIGEQPLDRAGDQRPAHGRHAHGGGGGMIAGRMLGADGRG